ncbi:P-loop containing nucleoside triphosphate hydrolase protein [Parathielavia hyrcaniae]|uniref:P-loop containing nucleoside triphosphate hydrolase protein n=1 Tax=Parathielavia hyrcaniae TaxID=113614 RepID=A0AAN6Q4X0_9PEZI|nr:P-loop containing nucleoside triphosphate hydrolase protein [Parathielavia hyrcaniae]
MADYDDDKKRFIFVIGAPGAGKGTLAKRLAKEHDFTHISVGDILRENADKSAAIGWHVKNGELVPSDHLFPLLRETFRDCSPGCPIILDGFPRRLDQIRGFEKAFGPPHLVLFFQCTKDVAKERVLAREEGRENDTREGFETRYKEYLQLNPPILDYYSHLRGNNKLVEVSVVDIPARIATLDGF